MTAFCQDKIEDTIIDAFIKHTCGPVVDTVLLGRLVGNLATSFLALVALFLRNKLLAVGFDKGVSCRIWILKSIAYLDLSLLLFQGVDLLLHGDPISSSGSLLLAFQVLGGFLLQATVQLFLELFGFDLVLDLVLAGFLEVLVDIYLVQLVYCLVQGCA